MKHLPDAVTMILPPLNSFPLEGLVTFIAVDACCMARNTLALFQNIKYHVHQNKRPPRTTRHWHAWPSWMFLQLRFPTYRWMGYRPSEWIFINQWINEHEARSKCLTLAKNTSNLPSSRKACLHTPDIAASSAASAWIVVTCMGCQTESEQRPIQTDLDVRVWLFDSRLKVRQIFGRKI